jgi:S-adenosyl-L-methionine hydrolase (adenosine-forming)
MPLPQPISFLSDYGHSDAFVGICHGVIQRVAPGTLVIDLAHGVGRHAIEPAAIVLRDALPYLPPGVHLAIVDPGVGTTRRPVALRCGDRFLVGPDNGILWPAAERLGGVESAVDLSSGPWRLEPVSATFHGRDLFAPAAAHLALGEPLEQGGEPFDPASLVQLALKPARVEDGVLSARVATVDGYGNVQLDAAADDLASAGIEIGDNVSVQGRAARSGRTFADVSPGELVLYLDSFGAVALAVNGGDAASELGLTRGDEVSLERPE